MAPIVPRWEWRAFGSSFDGAEQDIASALPAAPAASREIYLVCRGSDLNVKVRHGSLEIKALQETSAEGLEQWMPVLKAPFPLDRAAAAALYAAWKVAPPLMRRSAYDQAPFYRELIDPNPRIDRVQVTKARRCGAFGGCLVELADLTFDAAATRTLAVESEDPRRLLAALQILGLSPHDNVNYVRALAEHVAHHAARAGSGAKEAPRHDETLSA